ncbi:spore germination protein [Cohnella faecalis]|uniref:Spore germination protein n=1 Tax=Cohnella faecalis TaxID=2315694 RepID=A0A398CQJ2_9BACL|nr:spore germination protein [Cohnella faecalis]RIE04815.1 spore germination protein [Cohnella faecalis]
MLKTGHSWFDDAIEGCSDVRLEHLAAEAGSIVIAFEEAMIDYRLLYETIVPKWLAEERKEDGRRKPPYQTSELHQETDADKKALLSILFSGAILLFADGRVFAAGLSQIPGRSPEESSTEISVKGPKDGLIEELSVNIALIRKRLRSVDLKVQRFAVGSVTQTPVALLYVASRAKPELIEEACRRIRSIKVDALEGAAIEGLLQDNPSSLFPELDYSGRPDYLFEALMKGRVVFLVEGTPQGFVAPINMFLLLKSPEDSSMPYYFVTFERIIRLVGLVCTLLLPGFWVALSAYNPDQIPFPLLATVIQSRNGLPLSTTMEMTLMLLMFELFREAGVRLPRAVGQTVAVVGGLIVGDAAIRAGMTSPTMLVVSAITAVTSFTLVNQTLIGAVTVLRFGVLLLSSVLGMFGFFIGLFSLILYVSTLNSFGHPYLSPVSPIRWKDVLPALIRLPIRSRRGAFSPKRPESGSSQSEGKR